MPIRRANDNPHRISKLNAAWGKGVIERRANDRIDDLGFLPTSGKPPQHSAPNGIRARGNPSLPMGRRPVEHSGHQR
jgi:hypothetical protein